jgi:hypothetical protein
MTWIIGADRSVRRLQRYVDVPAMAAMREQQETDQPVIEAISECLTAGAKKQLEIVEHCRGYRFSDKRVRAVLKRYRAKLWLERNLPKDNAKEYSAIPRMDECAPSAEPPNRRNRP